jgi:hypothetical protein
MNRRVLLTAWLARGLAEGDDDHHQPFSPSRQAMASSSTRTASWTATTGCA